MTEKRYEFDNRKPSAFSRLGSAVIAVGSVATAISIAMPSVGSFMVEQTAAAGAAFGLTDNSAATPANDSANATFGAAAEQATVVTGDQTQQVYDSSGFTGDAATGVTGVASTQMLPTAVATGTSAATPTATPAQTAAAAAAAAPTSAGTAALPKAVLPLAPISSGNTSSPTPAAGNAATGTTTPSGTTKATTGTKSSTTGNTSSPTPAAGNSTTGSTSSKYYEDDEHSESHDSDDHGSDDHDSDDHDD